MNARTLAVVMFAALAIAGIAAQAKEAGNATDALNPLSPRYGHPYRHGVHPTREVHDSMKAWEAGNRVLRAAEAAGKDQDRKSVV